MLLHAVYIENCLSFREFLWSSLDLQLNLIVGPNGAGKSNLFQALRIARDALALTNRPDVSSAITHLGNHDAPLRVVLEIELTSRQEQELIRTFFASALCQQDALGAGGHAATVYSHPAVRVRISDLLYRRLTPTHVAPLLRGRLVVAGYGSGRWESWFEAGQDEPYFHWRLEGNEAPGLSGIRDATNATRTLFSLWELGMDDEAKAVLFSYLSGGADEPPMPDLSAALPQVTERVGVLVNDADSDFPTHRAFARLMGVDLNRGRTYDLRSVLRQILWSGLVFTENVRGQPSYAFSLNDRTAPMAPPSSGEALARYLFQLKTGNVERTERYRTIERTFEQLVNRGFDVGWREREPGVPSGDDAERDVLAIWIRTPWGTAPLEYSGAGVAEALFLSAVLSHPDAVVLLDEPASNLHPAVQRHLMQLLRSNRGQQCLVTTHSATLFPPDGPLRASRFYLQNNETRRAQLDLSHLSSRETASLIQVLHGSADVNAMLFSSGVVLVEGETEEGALPVWFESRLGRTLADNDWTIFDVGGDTLFGRYVTYLNHFGVRWAIVCDGDVVGDSGGRCSIAGQLRQAGMREVHISPKLDYASRRERLEAHGVFTIATSTRQDFKDLHVVKQHRDEAVQKVGPTTPRVARYIAEHYECPPEVAGLLEKVRRHLEQGGSRPV